MAPRRLPRGRRAHVGDELEGRNQCRGRFCRRAARVTRAGYLQNIARRDDARRSRLRDCVDAQSAQCDRHYDDVLLDVEKMLQDKQMRNEATLSTYREIYETCAAHANALMGHATYKNASFKAPSDHDEASLPSSSWTASCKDASKLTGADVLEAQAARSEDAAAFATVIIQCPSELLN